MRALAYFLVLYFAFSVPAFSAAAKDSPSKEIKAAASCPEQKKLSAKEVLAKLEAWDSKLNSLDISFTQEVWFKEADLKQTVEGNMQYLKPNMLRVEHTAPNKQIITTDKKLITIYKPDDRQAINATWDGWVRTQNQSFYGVLDFGNYSSLSKKNDYKVSGGGCEPYIITFTPKEGTKYSLEITLSQKDYFPSKAALTVGSAVTTTVIKKSSKNTTLDKAIFVQNLPAKTDIINF